mgnify:CR=1 FL=1
MTRRSLIAAGAAAISLLAGCTNTIRTPTGDTVASGDAYFALGTEPFWNVEITSGRIVFHDANGKRVAVANPGARPSFNGERYVTDRLTVDVTHVPCADGMSDRRYADSVMVMVDGRELRGCGGAVLAPAQLADTRWRIVSIAGTMAVEGTATELAFAEGRLTGSAGCNRLNAPYRNDSRTLTVGPVASTRMACPPALMAQENGLLTMLGQPLTIRLTPNGRLLLTAPNSDVIVLERIT